MSFLSHSFPFNDMTSLQFIVPPFTAGNKLTSVDSLIIYLWIRCTYTENEVFILSPIKRKISSKPIFFTPCASNYNTRGHCDKLTTTMMSPRSATEFLQSESRTSLPDSVWQVLWVWIHSRIVWIASGATKVRIELFAPHLQVQVSTPWAIKRGGNLFLSATLSKFNGF